MTKIICESCMDVERVVLSSNGRQVGNPCSWDMCGVGKDACPVGTLHIGNYDSKFWAEGRVHCPHKTYEVDFVVALPDCLRWDAQMMARHGVLVGVDEEIWQ